LPAPSQPIRATVKPRRPRLRVRETAIIRAPPRHAVV
jgi:hypothetical protein